MPHTLSVNTITMNIVTNFLSYRNQLQILHWQTQSYAEHMALGSLYETFDGLVDAFVESFMGKYGRVVSENLFTIVLFNYSDLAPLKFLAQVEKYLTEDVPVMLNQKDTDLLNIRDEMLGAVNKTKYLLTLK